MSLDKKVEKKIDLLMCPKNGKFAETNPEGMTFCRYEGKECPYQYNGKHCSKWYK